MSMCLCTTVCPLIFPGFNVCTSCGLADICISFTLHLLQIQSINQFIEGFISYAGGHPGTGQRLTLCVVVAVLA